MNGFCSLGDHNRIGNNLFKIKEKISEEDLIRTYGSILYLLILSA